MMRLQFMVPIAVLVYLSCGTHSVYSQGGGAIVGGAAGGGTEEEKLVPAPMGIRTDKDGNSWNIEQNGTLGRVGSTMINSGLNLLINNEQFYTYQPMMTVDDGEFVLQGRETPGLAGIQVIRRLKLLENEGAVRYLEIISNTTSNPANLTLALKQSFSGNYKSYVTNRGNTGVLMLGEGEGAVMVTPATSEANKSFIFTLTSNDHQLKPTISSQNRYGLTFQYNVALPPGQTVVLAHIVAQVPTPEDTDEETLAEIFQPLAIESMLPAIPQKYRDLMINYESEPNLDSSSPFSESTIGSLAGNAGEKDILALGEDTRLIGTASCTEVGLTSEFGNAVIPFADVVAVAGTNQGRRNTTEIYLKDGQVFSGKAEAKDLEFLLTSGGRMKLNVETMDRFVKAGEFDNDAWKNSTPAMIETYNGDRIAVSDPEGVTLRAQAPWGALDFPLKDVKWIRPSGSEEAGHIIEFRDGTRCLADLSGESITINSEIFSELKLPVTSIRAVATVTAVTQDGEESGEVVAEPVLMTSGSQKLVGPVLNPAIKVLTDSQSVELNPAEVQTLANVGIADGETTPTFEIKLWGGGKLKGTLGGETLSVQVRGQEWKVPLTAIRELVTPAPEIEESTKKEITKLISSLGADDWRTREQATAALRDIGSLAGSVLKQELQSATDPEVRRRIERLLVEFN